jgi:SAM-dependent methyltransferase
MKNKFDKKEEIFSEIYDQNAWGDSHSRSGTGSNLVQTAIIQKEIPRLLEKYGIKTMLDVPCGDFFWMKEIKAVLNEQLDTYIGGDIVEKIVEQNRSQYGDEKTKFEIIDICHSPLPKVDMIFCRDCLVHLPYKMIIKALQNFKRSGATYLLTTTFTNHNENRDIHVGDWRTLNLEKFPFDFQKPLMVINENCSEQEGIYADKSLGLWKISDLLIRRISDAELLINRWLKKYTKHLREYPRT